MSKVSWQSEFIDYLWKNIQGMNAVLILDDEGKILDKKITLQFEKEYNNIWLKNIADKISIRFTTKQFNKEMDGLELTINIFKNYAILVKSLKEKFILVMIVSTNDKNLTTWIKNNTQWWIDDPILKNDYVKK